MGLAFLCLDGVQYTYAPALFQAKSNQTKIQRGSQETYTSLRLNGLHTHVSSFTTCRSLNVFLLWACFLSFRFMLRFPLHCRRSGNLNCCTCEEANISFGDGSSGVSSVVLSSLHLTLLILLVRPSQHFLQWRINWLYFTWLGKKSPTHYSTPGNEASAFCCGRAVKLPTRRPQSIYLRNSHTWQDHWRYWEKRKDTAAYFGAVSGPLFHSHCLYLGSAREALNLGLKLFEQSLALLCHSAPPWGELRTSSRPHQMFRDAAGLQFFPKLIL